MCTVKCDEEETQKTTSDLTVRDSPNLKELGEGCHI